VRTLAQVNVVANNSQHYFSCLRYDSESYDEVTQIQFKTRHNFSRSSI